MPDNVTDLPRRLPPHRTYPGPWTAAAIVLLVLLVGYFRPDPGVPTTTTTTSSSTTTTLAYQYVTIGGHSLVVACVNGDRVYNAIQWGQVIPGDPSCPQDGSR